MAAAVRAGKLRSALQKLWPDRPAGPWKVLCDNEKFLRAPESRVAYAACNVTLWSIPPRSPDLNPVEKFWAWLRKELRRLDLADLRAKRPAPSAQQYRARVRSLVRTQKAKTVAQNCARGLRKVCKEVLLKKGALTRG